MTTEKPGLQYPNLGGDVSPEIQAAFKNVFDNLFAIQRTVNVVVPSVPQPMAIISSGIYLPKIVLGTNLTTITPQLCQWLRVGPVVFVSGSFSADPIAAVDTYFDMSLPVPAIFKHNYQCGGTAFAPLVAGQGAAVLGSRSNISARFEWLAVNLTNQSMYFSFGYSIP